MMLACTRRAFLEACATLAATPVARSAAAPDMQFPAAPRDRLAVASYPFRNLMDRPDHAGLRLTAFAAMVADQFNVHNIEPLSAHFRPPILSTSPSSGAPSSMPIRMS